MTSDAASVVSQGPSGLFPKVSDRSPVTRGSIKEPEMHFRDEWRRISTQMGDVRTRDAVDERLTREPFEHALDLAVEYPDLVEVTSRAFDDVESDLAGHVQGHFRELFSGDHVAQWLKLAPTQSNFRALVRVSEIVYLDDAVLRFSPSWSFEPAFDDLDTLSFNELPGELSQWMEQSQLLWDGLVGTADLSRDQLLGLVETLYSTRRGFVEAAIDRDLFLPIPPSDFDPGGRLPNLRTKFRRQDEIDPADVHRYCYRQVLDEF